MCSAIPRQTTAESPPQKRAAYGDKFFLPAKETKNLTLSSLDPYLSSGYWLNGRMLYLSPRAHPSMHDHAHFLHDCRSTARQTL
jgi:hypothetical protein